MDAKYISYFYICKIINEHAFCLQDLSGQIHHASLADIQLLLPEGYVVKPVSDAKAFGRAYRYINDQNLMPYLNRNVSPTQSNVQTNDKNARHKHQNILIVLGSGSLN